MVAVASSYHTGQLQSMELALFPKLVFLPPDFLNSLFIHLVGKCCFLPLLLGVFTEEASWACRDSSYQVEETPSTKKSTGQGSEVFEHTVN